MIRQRTLSSSIRAAGVGYLSGQRVFLTLRPAPSDTGIIFGRTDVIAPNAIPATVANLACDARTTTLACAEVQIAHIEHLLAAFSALGIDNAYVDVSAGELPVMDGSSAPFVFLIQSAGIQEQAAPKRFLRILEPVTHTVSGRSCTLAPGRGFFLSHAGEAQEAVTEIPQAALELSSTAFIKEVSRARGRNRPVSDEGNGATVRLPNEPARHKLLDAIGDLYLLGHALIGRFSAVGAGHADIHALMRLLLDRPSSYEIVSRLPVDAPVNFVEPLMAAPEAIA